MTFLDFLWNSLPTTLLELIAAIVGTIYLRKSTKIWADKLLVSLLWLTFFVEAVACYAGIGYFTEYEWFSFVKGTQFERNYWLHNIFTLISYVGYTLYFTYYIEKPKLKLALKSLMFVYVVASIVDLYYNEMFFKANAMFSITAGSLLVCLSIILMFLRLLRSDIILKIKYFLPIYIAIGTLVFNLCTTPIDIFSEYFSISDGYEMYVSLRAKAFLFANIFMYTTFIYGFIICFLRKK